MTNHSKTYYLVEDFDPNFDYRGGAVVPLNPLPLHIFSSQGKPYQIMESFYDERELRKDEERFFDRQMKWFDEFDKYIQSYVPFCREHSISLAKNYYNRIKYFVDAVIIQHRILRWFLEQVGPDAKIVYVKKSKHAKPTKFFREFKADETSLRYSEILPALCKNSGVAYKLHSFKQAEGRGDDTHQGRESGIRRNLLSCVKPVAKKFYHFAKYSKFRSFISRANQEKSMSVLFMHSKTPHLDSVIQDFMKQGHQVYLRIENKIFELSGLRERSCLNLEEDHKDQVDSEIEEGCSLASQRLTIEREDLLEWISRECGIDVSDFVLPYFQAFLAKDCPEMLKAARDIFRFYKRENIDYVISHTSSDEISKSALIAADLSPAVKSLGVEHGCDVFFNRILSVTDIAPFDLYFTTDGNARKRYSRYRESPYVSKVCDIYESSHYLKDIKSRYASYSKKSNHSRKTVLYIPTKLASLHRRYFNCMVYPVNWFLEYQKELFTYFSKKEKDFEFIYKEPLNHTGYVQKTVIPYLKEKKYSNIRSERKSMSECMALADAVIMDRPTTSFYEAMVTDLPVLAIYPDSISNLISSEEAEYFGKSLRPFRTNHEAISEIDQFLHGDPVDYRHKIPMKDDGLVDVLAKIKPEETNSTQEYSPKLKKVLA